MNDLGFNQHLKDLGLNSFNDLKEIYQAIKIILEKWHRKKPKLNVIKKLEIS